MMISTFVFDWSGTISDDRLPVYEANMRLLEKYGKPRMTFEEFMPKTTMTPREFMANEGVTEEPEKLFREFTDLLHKLERDGLLPIMYPDVPKTLEKLLKKNKKLFVVSSHPEHILKSEAKKYGLTDFFTSMRGNATEKTVAMLDLFMTQGINPSKEVSYTGDTTFDIHAAKKANIYSIGITTGYHTKERLEKSEPDRIVETFAELSLE